ncbi:copper oxidase [Mucilaginibacter sp. PPCGB 2223]|uniref:c-type cytochrome n=1 Tax=Mucilaginibacter sp. PPCGB 2223 TaxID=1886027 RepID=UPI0008268091|nr:cytochrome c [Mucilaginibacter sp. PPCGB 2223]OCX53191.1 copper oxidase [Mucilaginibacter sp. PPCGB 2223]
MKIKFPLLLLVGFYVAVVSSCQGEGEMTYARYYSVGSTIYINHCQNCHGNNGEGLGNLIPPFTDSVYLHKNLAQLPCFIKNGLKDTITVAGKKFSGMMPAQSSLSPIEIAEVLTYVTNSFGNKMGLVDVSKVEKDLSNCK